MAENKNLYTGTLIFCIIAGCVTIAIIAFFFLLNVEQVKYMLLTIEIILIIIIIHSIITIVLYERSMNKYNNAINDQPLSNLNCPDYFTKRLDNGVSLCENVYDTPKHTIVIGKPTQVDLSKMRKQPAIDTCQEFTKKYNTIIPWTELKSICETIA